LIGDFLKNLDKNYKENDKENNGNDSLNKYGIRKEEIIK